jgi:hypothetical protein
MVNESGTGLVSHGPGFLLDELLIVTEAAVSSCSSLVPNRVHVPYNTTV